MKFSLLLILVLVVKRHAFSEVNRTSCTVRYDSNHNIASNEVLEQCKTNKRCVTKCCGIDEVLWFNAKQLRLSCEKKETVIKKVLDKGNFSINKSTVIPLAKQLSFKPEYEYSTWNDFDIVLQSDENFLERECSINFNNMNQIRPFFLTNNGTFVTIHPNHYKVWNDHFVHEYCVDHAMAPKPNTSEAFFLDVYLVLIDDVDAITGNFNGIFMAISSFFMLLVLFVYGVLKVLQNFQGILLMAYIGTLLIGFILRTVFNLVNSSMTQVQCAILTPFCYFAILSSFFWVNLLSYDLWSTFRASRQIVLSKNRKRIFLRLLKYGVYGWGAPLIITIIATVIDNYPLEDTNIFIVKVHFENCLLEGKETMLYVHVPMLILMAVNCVFFAFTIYNIRSHDLGVASFDAAKKKTGNNTKYSLYLYFKLSALMGTNWLIEAVKAFLPDEISDWPSWIVIVMDSYTTLLGVIMFIMFICNKRVLLMLCDRFHIKNKLTERYQKSSWRYTDHSKSSVSRNSKTKQTTDTSVEMDELADSTKQKLDT